jgi:hypothetical protein
MLGALARKRDKGKLGSQGIANLINQDGNDGILDDVVGMLIGGMAGSNSQSGMGLVGNLLKEFTTPRCNRCGSSLDANFRFCPHCGTKK